MHPSASLCGCATYSGRLSCAQILEAADSIGVTGFLCRILDMDFGEFFFLPSTWVNKDRQKLQLYKATACQRGLTSLIVPRVNEWLQMRNNLLHTQKNLLP